MSEENEVAIPPPSTGRWLGPSQRAVSARGAGTTGPQPNLGLLCAVTTSPDLIFFLMLIFNLKPPTLKFSQMSAASLHVLPSRVAWSPNAPCLHCPTPPPSSEVQIFWKWVFWNQLSKWQFRLLMSVTQKGRRIYTKQIVREGFYFFCPLKHKKRILVSRSSNWPSPLRKHQVSTEAHTS